MFRLGTLSLFGMISLVLVAAANPPEDTDSRFNKALAVQSAMARARILITEKNAQKAVEVLEEQLPKVNGNTEYLHLLRDAYRAYIRDLLIAEKVEVARRYHDRLCILDPSAVNDPSVKPAGEATPPKFEAPPAKSTLFPGGFPSFNPFTKKNEKKLPEPESSRGVAGAAILDDPFDNKNQRNNPLLGKKSGVPEMAVHNLLAQGSIEFKNHRYAEARSYFEEAYRADTNTLDACREQWAYCIIKGVTDAMDQPGVLPTKLPELKKQVEDAIGKAPTKMMVVGQNLLKQLDERAKLPQITGTVTKVSHRGQNKEGWLVADTPNFRIFHRQDAAFAERVAQIAENTRVAMYRKWFGQDPPEWNPVCELILHPNAAAYTQMTGVPGNSPGHSRIESDSSGRVMSRRMDMRLDATGMMDAVLPHETTHIVLAGMFGSNLVPRWCDEGIAVLTEPNDKIEQHRRNLLKHNREGQLFGLKELMELKDYPQSKRIGAFYAQSVVLAEFLTQQKNPRVLTDFINDGLRHGYEKSLDRHYSMTFSQLEQLWQQQVIGNMERVAAMK